MSSSTGNDGTFSRILGSIKSSKSVNRQTNNVEPTDGPSHQLDDSHPNGKPKRASSFLRLAHAVGLTATGWLEDKKEAMMWPPAEWFRPEVAISVGNQSDPQSPNTSNGKPAYLVSNVEGDPLAPIDAGQEPLSITRPPSPDTLANRIKSIMGSLKPAPFNSNASSVPSSATLKPQDAETSTFPLTSHINTQTTDPNSNPPTSLQTLRAFLTDGSLMNGTSPSKGVWAALEKLKPPVLFARNAPPIPSVKEKSVEEPEDGSLMVYAPLIPDDASYLEVAESVIAPSESGDDSQEHNEHSQQVISPVISGPTPKTIVEEKEREEKEVRIWIPSTTSISLKLTWWGFSLYLPPSVLVTLQEHAPSIAQRAAMITTALKWILDKLPMAVIPLPARPAVTVARRIVLPVLGVVGAGVAGAWAGVLSYDKGHGVILTATWILPVALLPSTWDAESFKAAEEHAALKVLPPKEVVDNETKTKANSEGVKEFDRRASGTANSGKSLEDPIPEPWWKFGKRK